MDATAQQTSDNWAGYAVTTKSGFRRVVGTWVEPPLTCEGNSREYSAFWVGLGGFSAHARALEQIGTQADCAGSRKETYAWYELLPAGQVPLRLQVHPGDHMSASVTVGGRTVSLHLHDLTTGKSFAKTTRMASPDTSSAEWIAEAPSACSSSGSCVALPLANFGSVSFAGAEAVTRAGHTGTIGDPTFSATALTLQSVGFGLGFPGATIASSAGAQAAPSSLSSSGASFTVSWQRTSAAQEAQRVGPPGLPEAQ